MKASAVSVGEALSRAREQRGLSVDAVAADTMIRATIIRAIEADDYALCGGSVYARGHIRSIARVVGVDPVPLIAEFDAANNVEPAPLATAAQPTDRDVIARTDRQGANWVAAMAVALVVICALALVGLLRNNSSDHGSPSARSTPQTTVSQNSTQKAPPSAVAQVPTERASMLVRTLRGASWMQVTAKNGTLLYRGLLQTGRSKLFTDKHGLVFVIGNAPAVDVVVNGHDIGSPHSAGSVSRGRVIPGADTVSQA